MNIDKRLTIEVIGLAAVVLSLIFLGVEVQQNSQLMRSQIRDSVTDKQLEFYSIVAGSTETSEVVVKGLLGDEEMSPAEVQQYLHWINASLRMWENEWFQFQNGLFGEDEFLPRMQVWSGFTQLPAFRDLWNFLRDSYSPGFREQIDLMIDD